MRWDTLTTYALRPKRSKEEDDQGPFNESFADLNALFNLLSRESAREKVLYDTRGNLHEDNFVASVADRYGKVAKNRETGSRNADEEVTMSTTTGKKHDKARILTGIAYDMMVSAFEERRKTAFHSPATSLGEVSRFLWKQWIFMTTQLPLEVTFSGFGDLMVDTLPENNPNFGFNLPWESYARGELQAAEIKLTGKPNKALKWVEEDDEEDWGDDDWFSPHQNEG